MSTARNSAKLLSLMIFSLILSGTSSIPSSFTVSVVEQREPHLDNTHSLPPSNEAPKTLKPRHRFNLEAKQPIDAKDEFPVANNIVPDLQVGCGDGLLVETTTSPTPSLPKHKILARKERRKRETSERKRRAYFTYTIHTPSSISYSIWKPSVHKIQRPYFIPIWGSQGRLPIYFPPQAVFLNPGYPLDNPPSRGYLPPLQPTTQSTPTTPETETETDLFDRFGEPIWGMRPASPTSTTVTPTRRPSKPRTSTFPPLVHDLHPQSSGTENLASTTVSPPSLSDPNLPAVGAPQATRPSAGINQCVLAIINCCSGSSRDVSSSCFERLGCPGPFWDRSPCESNFARQAVEVALNYYQAK